MKPENFISTTDYATLSNDGTETFTLTIPGNSIVNSGQTRIWSQSKEVGAQGAFDIVQIWYTGRTNRLSGPTTMLLRRGHLIGWGDDDYSIRLQVSRTDTTTLTAQAEIFNPWPEQLRTNAAPITINFYVTTFIPPF